MSALVRMRLVALTAIACLATGNAIAQQATERVAGQQRDSAQATENTLDRSGAGQSDRFETQTDRSRSATTQQRSQTGQLGQRNTRIQAGGQNPEVDRFLAACLLAKNQAEVELGQFAQQQAENPQVKQFAQQMVQDHQQLVEKLQPLAGNQSGQSSTRLDSTSTSQSIRADGQNDAQRQPGDTTRLPGSSGAGQTESRGSSATLETQNRSQISRGGSQDSGAVEQLIQIDKQIVERHSQAVREELQQKSGAEFDKCYVGSMVAAHMDMLAALEVISQQQGQLSQVAQQAQPKVQQHLDHAKQLMKQLESGARSGGTAERQTPQTPRTQRQ